MIQIAVLILSFTLLGFLVSSFSRGVTRFLGLLIASIVATIVATKWLPKQPSAVFPPDATDPLLTALGQVFGHWFAPPTVFLTVPLLGFIVYATTSTRIVREGNEALVERLGRYYRKLTPGVNLGLIPFLDEVIVEASTREQTLDVAPTAVITKDDVVVSIDATIFWRILELERAYYNIGKVEEAIKDITITTLRSELGGMALQETYAGRNRINRALLETLDEATESWGVKVTRVEIMEIDPPAEVKEAMGRERSTLDNKRAVIAEAEGRKQAALIEAEALSESIKQIQDALGGAISPQEILKYLASRQYIEANQALAQSSNAKIVFIDPKALSDNIAELMSPNLPE